MKKEKFILESSILMIGSLIGAASVFFMQLTLARQLTTFDFGVLSSSIAIVTLFASLAGFGIPGFWLEIFSKEGQNGVRWIYSSFLLSIFGALAAFLMLNLWAMYGNHGILMASTLSILSFYMFGQVVVELVNSKLQLEGRYTVLAMWQFLPQLARFLFILILSYTAVFTFSIEMVVYVYLFTTLVTVIAGFTMLTRMYYGYFSLEKHINLKQSEDRIPTVIQVASRSWPFGLLSFFFLIYFQSDIIMLMYLSGGDFAGIYSAACLLLTVVYLLPGVVYQKYLLPKFHYWANHDQKYFYTFYKTGNFVMLALGMFVMVLLWQYSDRAILIFFGEKYQDAVPIIKVLSIAVPIHLIIMSVGSVLITHDARLKLKYMGIATIVNIVLNFILIPLFEAFGAAVATVASELILLMLYFHAANNIFNTKIPTLFIK
jgi:O-antigen/teichoic acid export membrane protein